MKRGVPQMWSGSRRRFALYLFTPLLTRLRGQSAGENGGSRIASRTYRCDAVILLLGMAIYRRAGVGGGRASLEETGEGESLRRTLFFAGGSDPQRARGLNRLGWIREIVTGPVDAPVEASYFGVMTSSPEESLDSARKSTEGPTSGRSVFSAASGRHTPGRSRSAVAHFDYVAGSSWSDGGLIEQAHSTFQASVPWRESRWPQSPTATPSTFLLELATLLQQQSRRASGRYVYCEQEYSLELETAPNREFRGKVRNLKTGKESRFRLWLAPDSLVPLRIEYQARSFLRLTFEAVG